MALKHAGSIYGVVAPKKVAPTNPEGTEPYKQSAEDKVLAGMNIEELRVMRTFQKRMRAIASGMEAGRN